MGRLDHSAGGCPISPYQRLSYQWPVPKSVLIPFFRQAAELLDHVGEKDIIGPADIMSFAALQRCGAGMNSLVIVKGAEDILAKSKGLPSFTFSYALQLKEEIL
jgi:hypothetical protein